MKLYNKFFSRWTGVALLATMGLFACQPEIEVITPTSGTADFTTYIALGNSLTAGFADNGVYRESQENSYPEMMAKSMREVNASLVFKTPLMPEGNGSGYLQLVGGAPAPVPADPAWRNSVASGGPYQNMGVPGARVKSLTQVGYGSSQGNPYYERFASNPLATIVGEAAAQNPTFFTLWIGNNDVLGYATSGGDQGGNTITPIDEFKADFDKIIAGMNGASGGAIANIPNILAAPFFTTAPFNAFVLDAALAARVNAGIEATIKGGIRQQAEASRPAITAQVTAGLRQGRIAAGVAAGLSEAVAAAAADAYIASAAGEADIATRVQGAIDGAVESNYTAIPVQFRPTVKEGANPFIVQGERSPTNPTGLRSATDKDLILLTVLGYTGSPAFAALPVLPERFVLDVSEQAKVNAAIEAYNGVIEAAAGSKYAYVNINTFFSKVISGFSYQGVGYSPSFVTGGAFSLDGIHLTQRGYALAGNEFIKAINAKYNSKLSLINVNDYRGILFP